MSKHGKDTLIDVIHPENLNKNIPVFSQMKISLCTNFFLSFIIVSAYRFTHEDELEFYAGYFGENVDLQFIEGIKEFEMGLNSNESLKNIVKTLQVSDDCSRCSSIPSTQLINLLKSFEGSSSLEELTFISIHCSDLLDEKYERLRKREEKRKEEERIAKKSRSFFSRLFSRDSEPLRQINASDEDETLGFDLVMENGLQKFDFPSLKVLRISGTSFTPSVLFQYLSSKAGQNLKKFSSYFNTRLNVQMMPDLARSIPDLQSLVISDIFQSDLSNGSDSSKFFAGLAGFNNLQHLMFKSHKSKAIPTIFSGFPEDEHLFLKFIEMKGFHLKTISIVPAVFVGTLGLHSIAKHCERLSKLELVWSFGHKQSLAAVIEVIHNCRSLLNLRLVNPEWTKDDKTRLEELANTYVNFTLTFD